MIGTNCNGILSKKESLFSVINTINPGVLFLQETKVHRKGLIKIPDFQIFEVLRKQGGGGSILTAIHKSFQPVLVDEDEELEILVVQAKFGNLSCRYINAYGPKEGYSKTDHTISFYARLDQEIKNAKLLGHLVCVQLDANTKLGKSVIKDDIHDMSPNGQLLYDVIERDELVICNALDACQGSITRRRSTINGIEESILDYFIICQDLFVYFSSMKIDSSNVLTRYVKRKERIIVTKSDHNILICNFSQKWNSDTKCGKEKIEIFNFNDSFGQKKYQELTSKGVLSNC